MDGCVFVCLFVLLHLVQSISASTAYHPLGFALLTSSRIQYYHSTESLYGLNGRVSVPALKRRAGLSVGRDRCEQELVTEICSFFSFSEEKDLLCSGPDLNHYFLLFFCFESMSMKPPHLHFLLADIKIFNSQFSLVHLLVFLCSSGDTERRRAR